MTDRELMQQALEMIEDARNGSQKKPSEPVITALRERLAQPEQEPFCYHDGRNIVGKEYADHSDVFPLYTEPPRRKPEPLEAAVGTAYKTGWEHGKAVEREACAKVCENQKIGFPSYLEIDERIQECAAAIRERGQL